MTKQQEKDNELFMQIGRTMLLADVPVRTQRDPVRRLAALAALLRWNLKNTGVPAEKLYFLLLELCVKHIPAAHAAHRPMIKKMIEEEQENKENAVPEIPSS